jgi:Heterokaryon incompatibility protein (HET)
MWLLGTKTLELTEFIGETPTYAILSHTWGQDEIPFKAMRKNIKPFLGKPGHKKIQQCCEQAAKDGYEWIWIDSCCIDKRSSAELSEAINSMFKQYANAALCYAYLEDISHRPSPVDLETLAKCRWFTRGWTLQELLAPDKVEFYAKDWTLLGQKSNDDPSFVSLLSSITGIDRFSLLQRDEIKKISIATRMS